MSWQQPASNHVSVGIPVNQSSGKLSHVQMSHVLGACHVLGALGILFKQDDDLQPGLPAARNEQPLVVQQARLIQIESLICRV